MSNAMRFGKRTLAGVAAGALALGALTIASAPAVSAKTSVKPKASLTGTVTPVRASFTGSVLESVPFASISWVTNGNLTPSDTVAVTLTTAPSPTATLYIAGADEIATATVVNASNNTITNPGVAGETLTSGATDDTIAGTFNTNDVASIGFAVNQAGTYAGSFTTNDAACTASPATGGGVCDVVSFSFTTTGKATALALTPATQSIATGGIASLTATLRDAAGNVTQPLSVDSVALTGAGGTLLPAATLSPTTAYTSSASLYDGAASFTWTDATGAGTYTVTATPRGTLPSGGVTTQTASVVVSGLVSTTPATNLTVSVPAVAYNTGTIAAGTRGAQVPTGTTAATVGVVGPASSTLRFAIAVTSPSVGGTINGSTSTQRVSVTTDSLGLGSLSFTIGGTALGSGSTVTVTQTDASNNNINVTGTSTPVRTTLTQTNAQISSATVTVDPSGAVTTKLGSTVPVNVLVQNQYGEVMSGLQVSAYRAATVTGTAISSSVTNAKGIATLTLAGATGITAGTTEQYSIQVVGAQTVSLANEIQVTYSGTGDITAMTVQVPNAGAGVTNPITNTTTSIAVMPNIVVPFSGVLNDTVSTGTFIAATGVAAAGNSGNYAQFQPTPTPGNPVTVTVPEGLKVCTAVEFAIGQEWNGCALTATVSSGSNVYVFGTKTGTFDVTFKSGAITATTKVRVSTATAAAYNVAITPAKQDLNEGDFSKVTVRVTDVFGNGVSNSSGNTSYGVTLTATGPVLLAGQTQSTTITTYASTGTDVTVLSSGGMSGLATLTVAPSAAAVAAANAAPVTSPWSSAGYIPPTAAAAPVKEAKAEVLVKAGAQKTISISGGRTTVSGKPGIEVVGFADGFLNNEKVKPWIRFPGQTAYTAGTARPEVKDEEFNWSRKTGKKAYVYFTSEDDAILSNRIIIAAN